RKVVDRQLNRFAPAFKAEAVPGGMLRHGPQPGAVAVELEVPPVVRPITAVEGEPGREHLKVRNRIPLRRAPGDALDLIPPRKKDSTAPVEEAARGVDGARSRHSICNKGSVT